PDRVLLRSSPSGAARDASSADAVVAAVPAAEAGAIAAALRSGDRAPQVALLAEGLQRAAGRPPPGTVAVGTYAWAGWAEPIDRVASFRRHLRRATGHLPEGAEQQGYDAVFLLASALEDTDGQAGGALVRQLERVRTVTLSDLPITLGPDDHLLADRHLLGLFAVAGRGEDVERWAPSWAPWRPLMRTFALLGMRTSVLDMDKRAFFPNWRRNRPDPFYWRSRFGIVTRPEEDPLH
ncbi:MAG TPA: ABC transporter substrate-binding protein, partial [Actinomycetota bacterium]|nr:ABC transporter substrate-binding protein [Actinomycetota bacterium]